ncbi:hypothetical protein NGM99_21270 [Mesorhizobium sp. RP14(2022)]|uniref:Uncharacterized protein n=1 Tax=Mesorhizobium liriopis TaxID=2953882 RepID=A0ABT1CBX0_9HYPH|nr:hypothetical protein [Mesorhizobium liriopis]MCO6052324.1 hypothetical protein [Mesorhizobium liriopis]
MTEARRNRHLFNADDKASFIENFTDKQTRDDYRHWLTTASLHALSRLERMELGHILTRSKKGRHFSRTERRMIDINRLIAHRYGTTIPEHDDPRDPFLFVVAHLIHAEVDNPTSRTELLGNWWASVAPWADAHQQATDTLAVMHPRRKHMTDAKAGRMLRLTIEERETLGITTMSPSDMTALAFKKRQKAIKRERDRHSAARKRANAGSRPQAASQERAEPWKALGCSRSTYFRRKAASRGETGSSPLSISGKNTTNQSQASRTTTDSVGETCDLGGGESPPTRP